MKIKRRCLSCLVRKPLAEFRTPQGRKCRACMAIKKPMAPARKRVAKPRVRVAKPSKPRVEIPRAKTCSSPGCTRDAVAWFADPPRARCALHCGMVWRWAE